MTSTCRICFDEDVALNMIAPCKCAGTSKYVHRRCLDTWRAQDPSSDNFRRCNSCRFVYLLEEPRVQINPEERRIKFRNAMIFDTIMMVLLIVFVVGGIAMIIRLLDSQIGIIKNRSWRKYIFVAICIGLAILYMTRRPEHCVNLRLGLDASPMAHVLAFCFSTVLTACLTGVEYLRGSYTHYHRRIWMEEEAEIERVRDLG